MGGRRRRVPVVERSLLLEAQVFWKRWSNRTASASARSWSVWTRHIRRGCSAPLDNLGLRLNGEGGTGGQSARALVSEQTMAVGGNKSESRMRRCTDGCVAGSSVQTKDDDGGCWLR